MGRNVRGKNALILEDYDIRSLSKAFPQQEVGVNVNRIYIQIAKFSNNPKRTEEIGILKNALFLAQDDNYRDYRYTVMTLNDVMKCFGRYLKKMPRSTFIQSSELGTFMKEE